MEVRNLWNWRIVAWFALIGPPVGGAVVGLSIEIPGLIADPSFSAVVSLVSLVGAAAAFSYIGGLIPAFLSGIIASVLWGCYPARLFGSWLTRAAAGASIGYRVLWLFLQLPTGSSVSFGDGALFSVVGAAGGAVAGLVAGRWVAPNNSFKPTPLRGAA